MLNQLLGIELTDKQTFMAVGALWFTVLIGLIYMAWNDESLWSDKTKRDAQGKELKRATPRPRPATPRRTIATAELWRLGVYELTIVVGSLLVFAVSFVQINATFNREYATSQEDYRAMMDAWKQTGLPGGKPGAPNDFTLDMAAALVMFGIGCAVFLVGAVPLYRTYRTILYGKQITGKSKGVVPDWTRSIVIVPANAITISYRPEGAEVDEVILWKGLPGESWFANVFPAGTELTLYYDEANPSFAVAPALLNITPLSLDEPEKKNQ